MTEDDLPYDSFLLVSFGGPEGPDDVMPFLENVLRGKNVPRERLLEVAEHYHRFGGVSPINEQNRQLLAGIDGEFKAHRIGLPVYWGNRNWKPLFADTLRQMKDDGCRRSLAFFTNVFSSYSGCRQYRENIIAAREEVGSGTPLVEKIRMGFNHPLFIDTLADAVTHSARSLGQNAADVAVLFTAHSLPVSMANQCDYVKQLTEASRLVALRAGIENWQLVYQSRSGPPHQPWLEPDVCQQIATMDEAKKLTQLVIVPIGFVSDHMEVMFDLDVEAAQLCRERGITMTRAPTVAANPKFVQMIRLLVEERLGRTDQRLAVGDFGPGHDVCPADCCLNSAVRARVSGADRG